MGEKRREGCDILTTIIFDSRDGTAPVDYCFWLGLVFGVGGHAEKILNTNKYVPKILFTSLS